MGDAEELKRRCEIEIALATTSNWLPSMTSVVLPRPGVVPGGPRLLTSEGRVDEALMLKWREREALMVMRRSHGNAEWRHLIEKMIHC